MGAKFSITDSIIINRLVEDVYAFAFNYGNDPLWRKGVLEMRMMQDGDPCVGMQMREVLRS